MFPDAFLLIIVFAAGVVELVPLFIKNNKSKKEKRLHVIIAACFFMEDVFFCLPWESIIIDIGCSIAGIILIVSLICKIVMKSV